MGAKRTHGFTTEFAIAITILLVAVNMCLGTLLMGNSKKAIKKLMQTSMLNIANSAADMIDGNVLKNLTAEDIGTPGYQKIYDTLKTFQDNIDLEYIYCIQDNGNRTFSFSVDPAPEDPGEFGSPIVYTDALYSASLGIPGVDNEAYTDAWGSFYSAYSPVYDSNGKVAGIVGVDFSSEWYDSQMALQTYSILSSSLVALVLGVVLLIVTSWRMKQQLKHMTLEISDLAKNVDELANELNTEGIYNDLFSINTDNVQIIGKRIHSVKEGLKNYTDSLHSQAISMISALSSDYYGVYCINVDKDEGLCYLANTNMSHGRKQDEYFEYEKAMVSYAQIYVTEKYRNDFIHFMSLDEMKQKLEKERTSSFLYTVNRNGQECYEMVRLAALKQTESEEDAPVHEVCIGFSDVDEETRRALQQSNALSNALSAAESANKAKTIFLSNMSHEIRTPMNAIIGLYRLALNNQELPSTTRDYLEKIGTSAEHLLNVINEILDMSRIESGKMILRHETFSLPKLLEQINIMIGAQCNDKGLSWYWSLTGSNGEYYIGDEMKLMEVLINILGNAVKFTPKGGSIVFTTEGVRHYEGKTVFLFTVKDTGIGMSKEYLPKLFEPFSLEDYSLKTNYGSTGLGMSITKSIVDMMNGDIQVESEKNTGTTFTVTITMEDCKEKNATIEVKSEKETSLQDESKNNEYADLRGKRILIAEDVDINAEILQMILDVRGVETVHVKNGKQAVEAFSSHPEGYFDAILMDIRMPEMDGLEATRTIRKMDTDDAKNIPIIALTANAFDEDMQNSLQSGLNAHLSKPIEPEILFETLEDLIITEHAHRQQL